MKRPTILKSGFEEPPAHRQTGGIGLHFGSTAIGSDERRTRHWDYCIILAADPVLHAEACAKRRKYWQASEARKRHLVKRRERYEEDRKDPVWAEKERARWREKMRRSRAAKKAEQSSLRGGEAAPSGAQV
jgi:hypothetical protein